MRIIRSINIGLIDVDRWALAPRTLALVEHLRSNGTVPPIHVRRSQLGYGRYVILDGRHRITATKLLGRSSILARYAT